MNFVSHSCLSVINVYLINLKEHKTKKVKCKIINWYAVLECACLLIRCFFVTCFLCFCPIDVVWAKITLNLSLSLSFFSVAGIKEYKSGTFCVTDGTTFYEMVALRIGFKLLLTYANCVCNRSSTK